MKNRYLSFNVKILLIVPYGIETPRFTSLICSFTLLIVPYGIETRFNGFLLSCTRLLIVPYGIETKRNQDY